MEILLILWIRIALTSLGHRPCRSRKRDGTQQEKGEDGDAELGVITGFLGIIDVSFFFQYFLYLFFYCYLNVKQLNVIIFFQIKNQFWLSLSNTQRAGKEIFFF